MYAQTVRNFKLFITFNFVTALVLGLLGPFFILHVESLSTGVELLGIAFGVSVFSCSASAYYAGKLSDRFGRKPFLYLISYIGAIVLILYTVVETTQQLLILQALLGAIVGASGTIETAMLGDLTEKANRGTSIGKYDAIIYVGGAIGLTLSGFAVSKYGIEVLFYIAATMIIISTIFLYFIDENDKAWI